ncbi:MAG: hypothetical protein DHS20C16_05290 [Phycisphaerae bacterium]|nr:MAG: hypothetical protein DHS20C16_05290 [Phycisphaerae bacterium]
MSAKQRGLTLVEVGVVLAVMSAGLVAVSAAISSLSEDAQSTKCLSNLQRGMQAVLAYSDEHEGVLPGPMHPMIFRQRNDSPGGGAVERHKSMSWYVGPYLTPNEPAAYDPSIPNVEVDELFRCPTATTISPDSDFGGGLSTCYSTPVFNYVSNTWGPIALSNPSAEPTHTDPPHYFGAWFFCDSSPERPDLSWWPKRLDSIPNASTEWALADAWYRRLPNGPRGGSTVGWQGTFAPQISSYLTVIPSAPFHKTNPRNAKSHLSQGFQVLPHIALDGETNMAFMDGHVAPFVGNWRYPGEGGTVNPYWDIYSGEHHTYDQWKP